MDEDQESRARPVAQVRVTRDQEWHADLVGGGRIASADSIFELREKVAGAIEALGTLVPDRYGEIEWTYTLADGTSRSERQRLPSPSAGTDAYTVARWHQARVDEHIRELRARRAAERDGSAE